MKEAVGETNMTLVTIMAVGAILAFALWFVPNVIIPGISNTWNDNQSNSTVICPSGNYDNNGNCIN